MAPFIKEFEKNETIIDFRIYLTALHREMLDKVMRIFDIHADYAFTFMKPGG